MDIRELTKTTLWQKDKSYTTNYATSIGYLENGSKKKVLDLLNGKIYPINGPLTVCSPEKGTDISLSVDGSLNAKSMILDNKVELSVVEDASTLRINHGNGTFIDIPLSNDSQVVATESDINAIKNKLKTNAAAIGSLLEVLRFSPIYTQEQIDKIDELANELRDIS